MKNNKIILILSLSVLLSGCQFQGFKTLLGESSEQSQCTPAAEALSYTQKPLQNYYQKNASKLGYFKPLQNGFLPDQYELSVLLDLQCLERGLAGSLLSRPFVGKIKKDYSKFSSHHAFSLKLPAGINLTELEQIANSDSCVVGVTQETYAQTSSAVPNDPLIDRQTYLQSIKFFDVYEASYTAADRLKGEYIIAVIDTGYWLDHPDLVNQWWVNPGEIPDNQIDDDNNGVVDDVHGANWNANPPTGNPTSINYSQHGVHVAGLVAAQMNNQEGIASVMGLNGKIMAINVWPALVGYGGGQAVMSVVANAIRYAVDNGARVINMSLQSSDLNPNIEAAMIYAVERNVIVVSAAGNYSQNLEENIGVPAHYSSDLAGAIAVAATDSANGNTQPERCRFSNFSSVKVEIGAPGCDSNAYSNYGGWGVLSCVPLTTDNSGYGLIQGTSMASPIVAGAAAYTYALLKEKAKIPQPSAALVEEVLTLGSSVNPNLIGVTKNAKHLDLKSIHDYIIERFVSKPHPGPGPDPGNCQ